MKYKNIIDKFSRKGLLFAFAVLFTLTSCDESMLDENPKDFLTPGNAYSKPTYIEQGIVGLHEFVRTWWTENSQNPTIMTANGTDLAYYGEDPGGGSMHDYTTSITTTGGTVRGFWDKFYSCIQKANVLIESIKTTDEAIWTSETQKKAFLAEPMFFRALAYRNIVTLWGDAPLVIEAFNYVKTDFVRAPKASIFALIEEDLIFAAANLPKRGKESAPGRITQGAAWQLLSEVYLAQSKYQAAVDAASHVINDYGYGLMTKRFGTKTGKDVFKTGDPYFDLFTMNNHNLAENTESIWVIQVEPNVTGGSSNPSERQYGCAYYRMGNTPDGFIAFRGQLYNGVYTGYSDTLGRPVAWTRPTSYLAYKIWRSNWNKDMRNAEHNIKRNFYFDNPASKYNGQKIQWSLYPSRVSTLKDTCQYLFPYFMKAAAPFEHYVDLARSGGGQNHKDIYAMRLAETYLLRAEAYLGLQQKDKAANDINVVRNRAKATPVTPDEVTIDYILDERARELYTEEWRMITLMRLGKLVERVRKYNDNPLFPGLNIQNYHNLWPIPQTQIDLNVDAVINQNPGY